MEDITLYEGDNRLDVALNPVTVLLAGRIGQWTYSTTCASPTSHRETGTWPNHLLEFDLELQPSTFYILISCHNDSAVNIKGKLAFDTNAMVLTLPEPMTIYAGKQRSLTLAIRPPTTPIECYFNTSFFGDNTLLDQGTWRLKFY